MLLRTLAGPAFALAGMAALVLAITLGVYVPVINDLKNQTQVLAAQIASNHMEVMRLQQQLDLSGANMTLLDTGTFSWFYANDVNIYNPGPSPPDLLTFSSTYSLYLARTNSVTTYVVRFAQPGPFVFPNTWSSALSFVVGMKDFVPSDPDNFPLKSPSPNGYLQLPLSYTTKRAFVMPCLQDRTCVLTGNRYSDALGARNMLTWDTDNNNGPQLYVCVADAGSGQNTVNNVVGQTLTVTSSLDVILPLTF